MRFATQTAYARLFGVALGAAALLIGFACGVEDSTTLEASPTPQAAATYETSLSNEKYDKPSTEEPASAPEPVSSYLAATVEPCTPVEGSDIDPCERREEFQLQPFYEPFHGPYVIPPPTYAEAIGTIFTSAYDTPHMAIRAIALPGTTRCSPAGSLGLYSAVEFGSTAQRFFHCFADFEVRDYIVGNGPGRLTIWTVHGRDLKLSIDWADESFVQSSIVAPAAEPWEGYEWMLTLAPFVFATTEVWEAKGASDLQRLEDGAIVAVSVYLPYYERMVEDGLMAAEHLAKVKTPLDAFEQDLKDAIGELNGKVMGEDPDRPSLVQDANSEFLHGFFVAQGVYDHPVLTPAPPPPVPGGDDPVGSGVPSNEGETGGPGAGPGDPTPAAGN